MCLINCSSTLCNNDIIMSSEYYYYTSNMMSSNLLIIYTPSTVNNSLLIRRLGPGSLRPGANPFLRVCSQLHELSFKQGLKFRCVGACSQLPCTNISYCRVPLTERMLLAYDANITRLQLLFYTQLLVCLTTYHRKLIAKLSVLRCIL